MAYPDDFSRHLPMSQSEMERAVESAIRFRLRNLRPILWKKHMTLDKVVEAQPVGWFAREVAAQLILSNSVLFKGPPLENHIAGGERLVERLVVDPKDFADDGGGPTEFVALRNPSLK